MGDSRDDLACHPKNGQTPEYFRPMIGPRINADKRRSLSATVKRWEAPGDRSNPSRIAFGAPFAIATISYAALPATVPVLRNPFAGYALMTAPKSNLESIEFSEVGRWRGLVYGSDWLVCQLS